MTTFLRDSLIAHVIAATWMSGCSDDPAQPGTSPDSGPPLDVASDAKVDVLPDTNDAAPADVASDRADLIFIDSDAPSPCTEIDASLVYDKAGCGTNTPAPVCRGSGDACLSIFCGCDGVTFTDACNWANKPFAHFGACPDTGWPDANSGG